MMVGRNTRTALVILLFSAHGAAAAAPDEATKTQFQTTPAPRGGPAGKIQVFGHVGYDPSTRSFTETTTFEQFLEQGSTRRDYEGGDGISFEIGSLYTITASLGVMASVEIRRASHDAELSLSAPNPLLFNRPNSASTTATGLDYTENAVHVDIAYTAQASEAVTVDLFAGPSFFFTTLTLIDEATTNSVYPFTELTITNTGLIDLSESAIGFNAGAILTYFFSQNVGASFSARFSTASLEFVREGGEPIDFDAGGFRVGGGLRLRF